MGCKSACAILPVPIKAILSNVPSGLNDVVGVVLLLLLLSLSDDDDDDDEAVG